MVDTTHEAAAEIVIGSILHNPDAHLDVVRQRLSNPVVWPVQYSSVYLALCDMADDKEVITAETVAHKTGIDVDRLLKWQAVARQSVTDAEVDANVEIVLARGKMAGVHSIGAALQTANGDKSPDAHIDAGLEALTDLQHLGVSKDLTPPERTNKLRARIGENKIESSVLTTLGRLDRWTWRFRKGAFTLIASPYKQRKSTAGRNIALAAAARGTGVSIATCEDDKTYFDACFVSMIANQILLSGLVNGASFSDDEVALSGEYIMESDAWKKSRGQSVAVDRALDIYGELPIYIYDIPEDDAHDPWVVRSKFRRDALTRGVQLCMVDYIQLMSWPGETMQRQMENAATWSRVLAGQLKVHMLEMAQKNEVGVSGGGGYSPSIKGGGDLPAAAHSTMTTVYDSDQTPDLLTVKLKLARGARQGASERFVIEANSGLITGIERNGQPVEVIPHDVLVGSSQPGFDDDLIDDAPRRFVMGRHDATDREAAR